MLVYQQVPAKVPAGTDAAGCSGAQEATRARGSASAAMGCSQQSIFRLIQASSSRELLHLRCCVSPLLQLLLLPSSVLQRLMCVYVWVLGFLLVLTLSAIDF